MKKLIFGIFAHPDDEAFGPVGTLITEVASGAELHLILLTRGEAGQNPDVVADLGTTRLAEWQKSADLIGATGTHELGYADGHLDNTDMQVIARKIEQIVHDNATSTDEIEFITFDTNGVTGHIDHIVASRAASLAYYRLKKDGLATKKLRYYCLSAQDVPSVDVSWIFAENGRSSEEINEIIDCSNHIELIKQIVKVHDSQREDGAKKLSNPRLAIDYFIVVE